MRSIYSFLVLLFVILTAFPTLSLSTQYQKVIVTVQGLDKTLEPLVIHELSIKAAETEKKLNEERIESLHQIAPSEMMAALEALGYYHSHIDASLEKRDHVYDARYSVDLGPATEVTKVSIHIKGEGRSECEFDKIIHQSPLKPNTQLNHNAYETLKQALLSQALQLGYLDSIFTTSEIRVNQDKYTAEVFLELDTGKRYTIGKIHFQDNPYPSEYLERYIPWLGQPNIPYTTADLLAFQKALTETELFRYIRIDPMLAEADDYTVPLNVRLKPRPQNRYIGSLGYGTDSGPRAMLGWEHRRINYPGHRVNLELRTSKWRNNINLRYTIPGAKPATDRLVLAILAAQEKWRDDKYNMREEVSATQIKKVGKAELLFSLHGLLQEKYRELPGFGKKKAHLLYPDFAIVYTDIKQLKPKEEGYRLSANVRAASKNILSSTSFGQTTLFGKWIHGLGESSRIILRGELGATAIKNPRDLPLSMRFFTGGDQTVRGFGYRSLGPKLNDAEGNPIVIGGRYLAVGSIELEQRIYKEYSLALFYDTGQAMNKWDVRFAKSLGFGLRFQTPLGPLRIDIAQPLNIVSKKRPRIHLTLGMDL